LRRGRSAYKLKKLVRQTIDEVLAKLPPEEGLPPEERLKGLPAEEVARAPSPETREALARPLQ
jgi:hypothetical protein